MPLSDRFKLSRSFKKRPFSVAGESHFSLLSPGLPFVGLEKGETVDQFRHDVKNSWFLNSVGSLARGELLRSQRLKGYCIRLVMGYSQRLTTDDLPTDAHFGTSPQNLL